MISKNWQLFRKAKLEEAVKGAWQWDLPGQASKFAWLEDLAFLWDHFWWFYVFSLRLISFFFRFFMFISLRLPCVEDCTGRALHSLTVVSLQEVVWPAIEFVTLDVTQHFQYQLPIVQVGQGRRGYNIYIYLMYEMYSSLLLRKLARRGGCSSRGWQRCCSISWIRHFTQIIQLKLRPCVYPPSCRCIHWLSRKMCKNWAKEGAQKISRKLSSRYVCFTNSGTTAATATTQNLLACFVWLWSLQIYAEANPWTEMDRSAAFMPCVDAKRIFCHGAMNSFFSRSFFFSDEILSLRCFIFYSAWVQNQWVLLALVRQW